MASTTRTGVLMSTILRTIFASSGDMLIPAITVSSQGQETLHLVHGYEDLETFDEDGNPVVYQRSQFQAELPGVDNTGGQSLSFGLDNVQGEAQDFFFYAIDNNHPIELKFYTYIVSDLSGPAEEPIILNVTGAELEAGTVTVSAAHLDLLNIAFPRMLYDTRRFPALQLTSVSDDL